MSEINETPKWVDGIPFITRADKVEGGIQERLIFRQRL